MSFLRFYNNTLFSDCNIKYEQLTSSQDHILSFPIHKLVMSNCSKFIYEYCSTNKEVNEITLPSLFSSFSSITDIKSTIEIVLKYCYSNQELSIIENDITIDNIISILELSDYLKIDSLTSHIDNMISTTFFSSLFDKDKYSLLKAAIKFNLHKVKDKTISNIISSISISDGKILELDYDTFKEVISSDEIPNREKEIYDIILSYISNHKEDTCSDKEKIRELLKCVRYSYMSHKELKEIKGDSIMNDNIDLILEAMSVKLNVYETVSENDITLINIKPRIKNESKSPLRHTNKKSLEGISPIVPTFKDINENNSINDLVRMEQFEFSEENNNKNINERSIGQIISEKIISIPYDDIYHKDILYYIGTKGNTVEYENPTMSKVSVSSSSEVKGDINEFVGRNIVNIRTENKNESYFTVDLGEGRYVIPSSYAIRNRNGTTHIMLNWSFEGSMDNKTFDIIDRRNLNSGIVKYNIEKIQSLLKTPGNISHWKIENNERKAYRYFRIKQMGKNSSGNYILCLSGIELYGECIGEDWFK